jgi:hypothetical protein
MNKFDQLRMQLRSLEGRLAALENTQTPKRVTVTRSLRRKPRYVDLGAEEHLGRVRLWSHWQLLRRAQCGPRRPRRAELRPWSVEAFSADVRDAQGHRFPAREVWRWLSDHHTHPPGGPWDLRIRSAIQAATANMVADGITLSPGT